MTQLWENNRVNKGDLILTSGEGGVYPPGIIVGTVSELRTDPYDATAFAVIEPAADCESLTEAAVVVSFREKGVSRAE